MANSLRMALLLRNFGRSTGILTESFRNHKSFCITSNLCFQSCNSIGKYTAVQCSHKSTDRKVIKNTVTDDTPNSTILKSELQDNINSYKKLKYSKLLNSLTDKRVPEPVLVNTFQKILGSMKRDKEANCFDDKIFPVVCKALDSKLQMFSPRGLLALLDIQTLQIPVPGNIMVKLFKLILSNINEYTTLEKLQLYQKLKYSHHNSTDYKILMNACEVYFNECFESEVKRLQCSDQLLYIAKSGELPNNVRSIILTTLMEHVMCKRVNQNDGMRIIKTMMQYPDLVSKEDMFKLIRSYLVGLHSTNLLEFFIFGYKALIQRDESYYDEHITELFIAICLKKVVSPIPKIIIFEQLCLMGYLDDRLVRLLVDTVLAGNERTMTKEFALVTANTLSRISYHETDCKAEIGSLRMVYDTYTRGEDFSLAELCDFTINTTNLGCNTTNNCNKIFENISEKLGDCLPCRTSPLFLHHLARMHSIDSCLRPRDLDKLLLEELSLIQPQHLDGLNEYFGSKKYVLKGCSTSDGRCLHFVTIFGPNKKPMNMSEFIKQNNSKELFNVNEISVPEGSKMIIFQIFRDLQPIKFLNRPSKMSGAAKIYLKIFSDFNCILLNPRFFTSTLDKKKEYLDSQINEIFEANNSTCCDEETSATEDKMNGRNIG